MLFTGRQPPEEVVHQYLDVIRWRRHSPHTFRGRSIWAIVTVVPSMSRSKSFSGDLDQVRPETAGVISEAYVREVKVLLHEKRRKL